MKLNKILLCSVFIASSVCAKELNLDNKATIEIPNNYKVENSNGSFSKPSFFFTASTKTCAIRLQSVGEKYGDEDFLAVLDTPNEYKKVLSGSLPGSKPSNYSDPKKLKIAGFEAITSQAKDVKIRNYKLSDAVFTINTTLGQMHAHAITAKSALLEPCKQQALSMLNTLKIK